MTDKLIEAIKALYEIPGCDNPDKGHGALVFGVEAIAKATIATLTAEREQLRETLAWYGEQARLARLVHREGDAGRNALAADGGKQARAQLKEQQDEH